MQTLLRLLASIAAALMLLSAGVSPETAYEPDFSRARWIIAPVAEYNLVFANKKCSTDGGGTVCECYGYDAPSAGNCSPTACLGCTGGRTCGAIDCSTGLHGACPGCPVNGYTDKLKCICSFWTP